MLERPLGEPITEALEVTPLWLPEAQVPLDSGDVITASLCPVRVLDEIDRRRFDLIRHEAHGLTGGGFQISGDETEKPKRPDLESRRQSTRRAIATLDHLDTIRWTKCEAADQIVRGDLSGEPRQLVSIRRCQEASPLQLLSLQDARSRYVHSISQTAILSSRQHNMFRDPETG